MRNRAGALGAGFSGITTASSPPNPGCSAARRGSGGVCAFGGVVATHSSTGCTGRLKQWSACGGLRGVGGWRGVGVSMAICEPNGRSGHCVLSTYYAATHVWESAWTGASPRRRRETRQTAPMGQHFRTTSNTCHYILVLGAKRRSSIMKTHETRQLTINTPNNHTEPQKNNPTDHVSGDD